MLTPLPLHRVDDGEFKILPRITPLFQEEGKGPGTGRERESLQHFPKIQKFLQGTLVLSSGDFYVQNELKLTFGRLSCKKIVWLASARHISPPPNFFLNTPLGERQMTF